MRRLLRIVCGLCVVSALALAVGWLLLGSRGQEGSTSHALYRYFTQDPMTFRVALPQHALVEVGDEVRLDGSPDEIVGEVDALFDDKGSVSSELYAWCTAVRIRLYDTRRTVLHADAGARLVRVPQTAAWVVQTLLTEENLPRLAEEWNALMLEHRDEIFALVTPIVRDVILDIERHVEREMPLFLERHRVEVRALSEDVRQDFLDKQFLGFFEKELWPIAEPRLRPVITHISKEIWDEVPLWGFSWRLAYQTLPFTANDHLQVAWKQFVDGHVVPILSSHTAEIVEAGREIAREVLSRPEMAGHLRQSFQRVIESPRFQGLCQVFLREVILDNPTFHEAMERRWKSPEVRRAIEAATGQIEPAVRRMGDIVLGTRKEGITREFAKVLRAQILLKDLQRLMIDPGSASRPPLAEGSTLQATLRWDLEPAEGR